MTLPLAPGVRALALIITLGLCQVTLASVASAFSSPGIEAALPSGQPLLGADPLAAFRMGANSSASLEQGIAQGPGFTQVLRVKTLVDLSTSWSAEFYAGVPQAVANGDVVLLHFWARATETTNEAGSAFLRVAVQKSTANYDKSYEATITILPEWREYYIPFAYKADYAANASGFAMGVGFRRQTIEIGGMELTYYGKSVTVDSLPKTRFSYPGREADAPWRKAALERIEKERKGNFSLRIVDDKGLPVQGAKVTATLTRHAFQFGSAYQFSRIVGTGDDNRIYRQKLLEFFNAGCPENDLKWAPWIGEWGASFGRAQTMKALQWFKDHGLAMRGHVLVWPGWNNLPNAIKNLKGTALQSTIPQRVLDHIADEAGATSELTEEWDVENEPYANHDLMGLFGDAIQVDWFKAARKAHPTARLYLNDYGNHDLTVDAGHVASFETYAKYLINNGAPIGGLGLQAHISANPSAPTSVLATLDRYAALGLPIRFTEFDVNTDDEELQADYTRDFLILALSHPSVVGLQFWGFWEKAHWLPLGALFRSDWSERPAAKAYRDLVLGEWKSTLSGSSDAQGGFSGRGMYGDYYVVIEAGGQRFEKTFSLVKGESAPRIEVQLLRPRLIGLATRAVVGKDDETFIAGFITSGSKPKPVIVRALGPILPEWNVSNPVPDLEMRIVPLGGVSLGSNYGWSSSPDAARIRQTVTDLKLYPFPEGSLDSTMLVETSGAFTVPTNSRTGKRGVGMIEVYERDHSEESRLSILASRAFAGFDDEVVIAGIALEGSSARTLLIRALGPELTKQNVGSLLKRPYMVVMSKGKPIAANSGWCSSPNPAALAAAMRKVGAQVFDANSADCALIHTFEPGPYSVIVQGADGGTGVCMIEVYDLGPE